MRRKFLVRKCQPRETRSAGQLLVARPAFPRAAREPLRFSGRVELQGLPLASGCGRTGLSGLPCRLVVFVGPALFNGGCGQILPHHVLGSLQELQMEASARGNAQVGHKSAFVEVNVTWGAVVHFSTYHQQVRLQVWFHSSSCSVGTIRLQRNCTSGL